MMLSLHSLAKQNGFLTLVAVVLIMIMGFLGVALTYMLISGSAATTNHLQSSRALYLAEAGLEHAAHKLEAYTITNRTACSGLSISNTLGAGAYSVASTGPFYVSSPSTLNGALTASATVIPVVSTANYQPAGRLIIDRESINYAAISGNNFIGVVRGADGSTATTHATGMRVGQFQCGLTAQGGVPSLTAPTNPGSPGGKRILQNNVQLQEAWAVGNVNGANMTLLRWNRPTEVQWNNASAAGTIGLNGIFMISYADGWAVGVTRNFLRWSGSSWGSVNSGLPGVNYFGVYCSAGNDCHVAGDGSATAPVLAHWNGSTWTRIIPIGTIAKTFLKSVHCAASNDCWAVGDNAASGIFYQWNGITWTGIAQIGLSGYTYNGVFCNSSTDCWAVGANATFARKNGATWTNFASGLPAVQYNGIFCNSSSDCWAVGNTNGGNDVIVHWNGTAWSRDTSNPTPAVNLFGVSCAGPNDCWAVGANSAFVHWNGTNWVTVATNGLPSVQLNAIDVVHPQRQPQAAWQENFA